MIADNGKMQRRGDRSAFFRKYVLHRCENGTRQDLARRPADDPSSMTEATRLGEKALTGPQGPPRRAAAAASLARSQRFWRFSMMSVTTEGSASVEVSPSEP